VLTIVSSAQCSVLTMSIPVLTTLLLLHVSTTTGQVIIPVYLGQQDVVLHCNTTQHVQWRSAQIEEQSGFHAGDIEEGENYSLENSTLTIHTVNQDTLGIYQCMDSDDTVLTSFKVERRFKLDKLPRSVTVTQGQSTEDLIRCSFDQKERGVVFVWLSRPVTDKESAKPVCVKSTDKLCPSTREYNEEQDNLAKRVTITNGEDETGQFSILSINSTVESDRRFYICKAIDKKSSERGIQNCEERNECHEVETLLRVKDKLAPLWPAIGVIAEVILLVIILLVTRKPKEE